PGGARDHSSRRCLPVRATNTSSRLAWRVVRLLRLRPSRSSRSNSPRMARWGSVTVRSRWPASVWTERTAGRSWSIPGPSGPRPSLLRPPRQRPHPGPAFLRPPDLRDHLPGAPPLAVQAPEERDRLPHLQLLGEDGLLQADPEPLPDLPVVLPPTAPQHHHV